jgi:formiminotetrahydrofolate cyclodeaminase
VGSKCKEDDDVECEEGEKKSSTKGCVPDSGLGGLGAMAVGLGGNALSSGLSSAQEAATNAIFGKFTSAYSTLNTAIDKRNEAFQKQIEEFSIDIPTDEKRDAIMDTLLKKPVPGDAKIKLWGSISPSGAS